MVAGTEAGTCAATSWAMVEALEEVAAVRAVCAELWAEPFDPVAREVVICEARCACTLPEVWAVAPLPDVPP
jgi:hypothetical protein